MKLKLKKKVARPAPRNPQDDPTTRALHLLQGERLRLNHAVEDQMHHGTLGGQDLAARILANTYLLLDTIPLKEVIRAARPKAKR